MRKPSSEARKAGWSSRRRSATALASARRPACAPLAAATQAAIRWLGLLRTAMCAQVHASAGRPAKRWPIPAAACMFDMCGSCGLICIARAARSRPASGSPPQILTKALNAQADARLGLRASARSISSAPVSMSPMTSASASPDVQRATASSRPNAAARRASRSASAVSRGRSTIQPLPSRWE